MGGYLGSSVMASKIFLIMVKNDEENCARYSLLIPPDLIFHSFCVLESGLYGMYHGGSLPFAFQLSVASKCWQDIGGHKRER